MMTALITKIWLNEIVLALTPKERWASAGELNTDVMATRWFILIGVVALTVLTVSFLVVTYKKRSKRSKPAGNNIIENGGK
jgi:general stress protein CsbA